MIATDEQFIAAWLHWGRPCAKDQLEGLLCGETKEVVVVPDIPALRDEANRTISKAWIGVKSVETAADPTVNAAFTSAGGILSITTTEVAGQGQILNSGEHSPELRFDLTSTNTVALTPHKTYHCSIKVLMSDGALYPIERFTFNTRQQVVVATS